jgi:trk system potassium uptake protein TrkH
VCFSCLIAGWVLLQLPLSKITDVAGLDILFTAASAISSTGLVSVDIGKTFSFFGQLILLLLIQLGGIAYLVFNSFFILAI